MDTLRKGSHRNMKWSGGVLITLFFLVIIRYCVLDNPIAEKTLHSPYAQNISGHIQWVTIDNSIAQNPQNKSEFVLDDTLATNLFSSRNFSDAKHQCLQTWSLMSHLVSYAQALPYGTEAIKEAGVAWDALVAASLSENVNAASNASQSKEKEKQCPYSISRMNASEINGGSFKLEIPCGLVQGSSITLIGVPSGLLGNFQIDLVGAALPGEPDPPIVLHYNIRLHGDKITEDPVIVQNTWTLTNDWGPEERCPSPNRENKRKVDDLEQCISILGKEDNYSIVSGRHSPNFAFRQGYLFVGTLRVGLEGIHMTVDGKHITSFAYRDRLEPWLVSEVKISGYIKLISVLTSGLPTSELDHVADLEILKSKPLPLHKPLDLFVGIFSTANNFKRRMAVRRTWMQYDSVRSGAVAVRFFVGLHKNQMVNVELWDEARTYGDIQLVPFVDYYSLITWKTVAICIYGANVASAKYIMKTDDDSFVRVDELLSSVNRANLSHGLFYGLIEADCQPNRDVDSKWYISTEEWPNESYPPWAHGPGYVVSQDIAKAVYEKHKNGDLKMFKLEDVAMGIWIEEMKNKGLSVKYVNDDRVNTEGCKDGYVVAHYQEPRDMLCLWDKLNGKKLAVCC